MGFNDLKKKSKSGIDELIKKMDDQTKAKDGFKDDRLWRPEQDKSGNGFAIIRFLPTADGEDVPWAKVYNHAFQGPGGWYIENSLTTIGQKDPVGELNNQLWNSGLESDKDLARVRKRKLTYISNVYIVSDPSNPQNEGKVFLYKYGVKIYEKIQEAMKPEFNDEEPINPFDFWKGANFKLKLVKKDGYWNYDKSEFAPSSALLEDDDELETIYKSLNNLNDFVSPSEFKSYEDLKKRLDYTLGIKGTPKFQDPETIDEEEEVEVSRPAKETTSVRSSASSDDEDEDDALSYFQKLASD